MEIISIQFCVSHTEQNKTEQKKQGERRHRGKYGRTHKHNNKSSVVVAQSLGHG